MVHTRSFDFQLEIGVQGGQEYEHEGHDNDDVFEDTPIAHGRGATTNILDQVGPGPGGQRRKYHPHLTGNCVLCVMKFAALD